MAEQICDWIDNMVRDSKWDFTTVIALKMLHQLFNKTQP